MSLEALAEVIQVDASDIVRSLFMKGIMLSMNQVCVGGGLGGVGSGPCALWAQRELLLACCAHPAC